LLLTVPDQQHLLPAQQLSLSTESLNKTARSLPDKRTVLDTNHQRQQPHRVLKRDRLNNTRQSLRSPTSELSTRYRHRHEPSPHRHSLPDKRTVIPTDTFPLTVPADHQHSLPVDSLNKTTLPSQLSATPTDTITDNTTRFLSSNTRHEPQYYC